MPRAAARSPRNCRRLISSPCVRPTSPRCSLVAGHHSNTSTRVARSLELSLPGSPSGTRCVAGALRWASRSATASRWSLSSCGAPPSSRPHRLMYSSDGSSRSLSGQGDVLANVAETLSQSGLRQAGHLAPAAQLTAQPRPSRMRLSVRPEVLVHRALPSGGRKWKERLISLDAVDQPGFPSRTIRRQWSQGGTTVANPPAWRPWTRAARRTPRTSSEPAFHPPAGPGAGEPRGQV
jgi:hypothetical protein